MFTNNRLNSLWFKMYVVNYIARTLNYEYIVNPTSLYKLIRLYQFENEKYFKNELTCVYLISGFFTACGVAMMITSVI